MSDPDVIDLTFDRVLGPIQWRKPISDAIAEHLVGQVVQFFIPFDAFFYANLATSNLFGSNVYTTSSSFPRIALHQGIIAFRGEGDDTAQFRRCINVFDDAWNVVRQIQHPVKLNQNCVGIELIVKITPRLTKFEATTQFDIKSKATRSEVFGIAVICGQPITHQYQTFQVGDLTALNFSRPAQPEPEDWLRFSLTGEPVAMYRRTDFFDDRLPLNDWFVMKMHTYALYLDTDIERFELSLTSRGVEFRLARALEPIGSLAFLCSTPLKELQKIVIEDHIDLSEIIWGDESLTVRDTVCGPIFGYFWGKRKKRVGDR
jgi:hypothetical protein